MFAPHTAPRRMPVIGMSEDDILRQAREELIDEELDESFPASDPPSWVQGTSPLPH